MKRLPLAAAPSLVVALLDACGSDDDPSLHDGGTTMDGGPMGGAGSGDHGGDDDEASPVADGARRIEVSATSSGIDARCCSVAGHRGAGLEGTPVVG